MNLHEQFEEVLRLVAETGDRCIVVSEGHEPFVVMGLSNYRELLKTAARKENIATMTESELLDKINQDIAEWREARQDDLSEYEVSQFRVDPVRSGVSNGVDSRDETSGNPVRAQKTQDYSRARKASETQVPNLPVVEDAPEDIDSEYHLEPIS